MMIVRWVAWLLLCVFALLVSDLRAQVSDPGVQTSFHIRYIAAGAVYVDGGRAAGLSEGMRLVIRQPQTASATADGEPTDAPFAAEFKIVSVAETSAVCEIVSSARTIAVGDVVTLPPSDVELLVQKRAMSSTRMYPAVVSFTEGDPMDEDVREYVPKPPLPEINEARGRIGFDYSGISSGGGFQSSSNQLGFVVRADITRIYGTHWNLSGYWRGRIESRSSATQPTLQDLINRTYHMSLTYANPDSAWVAGIGRMYLPWASSLQTIDGGYIGRKLSPLTTAGVFAGSTPDPTSWSYNPNRRIAGSFVNFDGGKWDELKYSSTFGFAVSTLGWTIDRPFAFTENSISYKRVFSLYHSMQVDSPTSQDPTVGPIGTGLGQSFLTLRVQPHEKIELDLNHNYFRDLPTYDPQLVGTGLLDKFLFQGLSVGARVQLPEHLTLYTNIGRSNNSTDTRSSWNEMVGLTLGKIWKTGIRADVRYSKFDSAFAQGSYKSVTLSRNLNGAVRFELMAGTQRFLSPVSSDTGSRFVNTHFDVNLGSRYFFEGGFTVARGALQDYNQWYTTFGYRFDNRSHKRQEATDAPHP